MTSCIATAEIVTANASPQAPSDFFLRELFNGDAGCHAQIKPQIEFSKSRFARMLSRSMKTGLFENVETTMQDAQYHITRNAPCKPHWPNGSWSVYRINGDEIADRVIRERIVQGQFGPHYAGEVIARHSWCGYLGMTETFSGVREMIDRDLKAERKVA